jgi:threonylcarbamoyladenosine tRNA methylthiotransferase MtaB
MPQVDGAAIRNRAARLREKGRAARAAYLHAQVGREVELLMERTDLGRTPGFAEVEIGTDAAPASLVNARVIGSDGCRLRGRHIDPKCAP